MMLRNDYSFSEKSLGYGATVTLSVLAVASLGLRYAATPISCAVPPQFTTQMVENAHHMCFQMDNITVGYTWTKQDASGQSGSTYSFKTIKIYTYHHWVPFALGLAALLCLIPHALWLAFSGLLWLDSHRLVQSLSDNQRQNAAGRHVILRDSALLVQAGLRGGTWILTATTAGRKMLVLLVCAAQFILAALVFKPQLTIGQRNETAPNPNASLPLPEQFTCDVSFFGPSTQKYSLHCTLPLAQVYSKGFTFLFYFFLFLVLSCLLDTLVWICRVVIPGLRDGSLKRYLAIANFDSQTSALVSRFLDSLGADGHLLLAITADFCGPLVAADLTNHLWSVFKSGPHPTVTPSVPFTSDTAPVSLGPAGYVIQPPPEAAPDGNNRERAAGNDPDAIPLMAVPTQGYGKG